MDKGYERGATLTCSLASTAFYLLSRDEDHLVVITVCPCGWNHPVQTALLGWQCGVLYILASGIDYLLYYDEHGVVWHFIPLLEKRLFSPCTSI